MPPKLVRQNINFLEYPLWFQDKDEAHNAEEGYVWRDDDSYLYQTGYKPPIKVDFIFLLYLLMKSQTNDWSEHLELSRFEILKGCGMGTVKYWYDRLQESLKRWASVNIMFEGSFYDGKHYKTMHFHIIDAWKLEETTNQLHIRFSPEWLTVIKNSNFAKMLDFEEVKALRSPLATRLYELLVKTFKGRSDWTIGARKLAAKIPMKEQYPADIIPKIKTAVGRINEKTDLQIELTVRRPKRGEAIFEFEKLGPAPEAQPKVQPKTTKAPKVEKELVEAEFVMEPEQAESLQELLELMPEKERDKKTISDLVTRQLAQNGHDFARRNIVYANKHAKSNYKVYLLKAFKEDWGKAYEEELQEAELLREGARRTKEAILEKERLQKQLEEQIAQQAALQLASLPVSERQQLDQEAKEYIETNHPDLIGSQFFDKVVELQLLTILKQRIHSSISLK